MNRTILFLVFLILSFGALMLTADEIQPGDHVKITRVGVPQVSPDGKWIAYSLSVYNEEAEESESDIFLKPINGGDAIQLTAMKGYEGGYVWHPSEPKLAFHARRGEKKSQIFVIDMRGGEAKQITNVESGASSPQWSPDGKWIAFYSTVGQRYTDEEKEAFGDVIYAKNLRYYHLGPGWDEGKRRRIFVVPATGGEAKQLTDGECADEGDHSMTWSPDSKTIAFVSNREKEWWNTIDTNIFTVNIESGETKKISNNIGPDHSPAYSPDGKFIAWRGSFEYNYESENYKILIQPVNGTEFKTCAEDIDRNIRRFQWSDDSSKIYFSASDRGYSHIRYFNVSEPNTFHQITDGDRQFRYWNVLDEDTIVMLASTSVTPSDVYVYEKGDYIQITDDAAQWWADYDIAPTEEMWVTTKDGAKVQGWLVKPVGYEEGKKYPMVLSIHGGPHGMYGPYLRYSYQMLAQRGIAVLFTNPRGSDGYGQAFADAIHDDWSTYPTIDLMAFVDHVVEQGIADPDKLGVMGGSYGGFMTNWLIGVTDRFAAAISLAGLSNMVSFYGSTDEQFFAEKEMSGAPWMSKEIYLKNSPIWNAPNFKTPTMVVHGSNDWRVRPEQGRQLFTALQKMGVPSVYVEYPNEQHGVRGDDHVTLEDRLMLDWFGHWLHGKEPGLATYKTPEKYTHPPKQLKDVEK